MVSKHRLIVFLVTTVSTFKKYLTVFFIVAILMGGYIFIAWIDDKVTLSILMPISSKFPFR